MGRHKGLAPVLSEFVAYRDAGTCDRTAMARELRALLAVAKAAEEVGRELASLRARLAEAEKERIETRDRCFALVAERDRWQAAAESQNRQWSQACEERTEERARADAAERERDEALARERESAVALAEIKSFEIERLVAGQAGGNR